MNRRRSDFGKNDPSARPLEDAAESPTLLPQFLFRYLALACVFAYLWIAGDTGNGLPSHSFMLALCGVYALVNSLVMSLTLLWPRLLPRQSGYWFDCACLCPAIAYDPYFSLPVIPLLLQSVIGLRLQLDAKSFRNAVLLAVLVIGAGLGLRLQASAGPDVLAIWMALVSVAVAVYACSQIGRASMREEALQHLGQIDALTGLFNRRMMFDRARPMCAALRAGETAVVIFADMDNMRVFNDKHGHIFGDSVIQLAGHAVSKCLRADDLAARYGGDEIVAIFRGITVKEARAIAQRLQKSIAASSLEISETKVSVSIGMVEISGPNADFDTALKRADVALHRAKAQRFRGAITTSLAQSAVTS